MSAPSRHLGPGYATLLGVAVGGIMAVLVLATASPPAGYQWPLASRVENISSNFEPRNIAGIGVSTMAADCTKMLVDLDSNMPTTLWVVPHGVMINYNETAPSSGNYYWSGSAPVEHLSVVLGVSDPAAGFTLSVFDASYTENGTANFGFWFSASDCP